MNAYGRRARKISPESEALFGKFLALREAKHHTAKLPPNTLNVVVEFSDVRLRALEFARQNETFTSADLSEGIGIEPYLASRVLCAMRVGCQIVVQEKLKFPKGQPRNLYKIAEGA